MRSFPPAASHDGELVQPVVDELVRTSLEVRDRAGVRTPGEAAVPVGLVVRALERRQPARRRASPRLDRVDVPVVGPVGVGAALRHERDRPAVRRPGRQEIVVDPIGQDVDPPGPEVDDAQVAAARVEITVLVELELKPVDDDRRLRFLLAGPGLLLRARLRIAHDEHDAARVGRPVEVLDAAAHRGNPVGLAAARGQEPQLRFPVRVVPAGQEGEETAVRAPARVGLGRLPRRQPNRPAAVPAGRPDVRLVAVLGHIHRADRVGDSAPVRRNHGSRDPADAREIVEGERPRGSRGDRGRKQAADGDNESMHELDSSV